MDNPNFVSSVRERVTWYEDLSLFPGNVSQAVERYNAAAGDTAYSSGARSNTWCFTWLWCDFHVYSSRGCFLDSVAGPLVPSPHTRVLFARGRCICTCPQSSSLGQSKDWKSWSCMFTCDLPLYWSSLRGSIVEVEAYLVSSSSLTWFSARMQLIFFDLSWNIQPKRLVEQITECPCEHAGKRRCSLSHEFRRCELGTKSFWAHRPPNPLRSISGFIIKFDLILSTYAAHLLRSQLEYPAKTAGWADHRVPLWTCRKKEIYM